MDFTTFASNFRTAVISKDFDDYILYKERLEDVVKSHPDHKTAIQYLSKKDPSETNEYLSWMVKQHADKSFSEISKPALLSEVKKFHAYKEHLEEKDITYYDLATLAEAITEYERSESKKERERRAASSTIEPLQEVEVRSARLYQITLKLSVDRKVGYGIDSALNRIRAIEGVTIVANDSTDSYLGKNIILARIKFHPLSDSVRPETYVRQMLIPKINSSIAVPGVKVLEMIRKTLIRLV